MIRYILLLAATALLISCSKDAEEQRPTDISREIAQHVESTGEGEVITKVIEERKGGVYIIRVQIIRDGKIKETTHFFENDNFTISIPVSANIVVQSGKDAAKGTNTNILVFSQKLDVARDAMTKNDYVRALEALNEALKIDSYNPQAHMMKGSIFYSMGKHDLAKKEFDYVLKVDPENIEVKRFREFMESENENEKVKIEGLEQQ